MAERPTPDGGLEILDAQGNVMTIVPPAEVRNYRAAQEGQRARRQAESEEDLQGFASAQAAAEGAGVQTGGGEGQFPANWSFTPSAPRLNPITGVPRTGARAAQPAAPAAPGADLEPPGRAFGDLFGMGRAMFGISPAEMLAKLFQGTPPASTIPSPAQPIAPAQAGHFDPAQFGVGGEPPAVGPPPTGMTPAELMQRVGPRPKPPEATVDPALALAQQQAVEREGRMNTLFDTYQEDVEGGRTPKWLNALNIGLSPWTGGRGGVAREVDRQAAQRESIRNALLQVGLAREGTSEETARAALAAMSGEHGAKQENLARTYAEGVGARSELLGLESAADQRQFQAGVEAWREGAARSRSAFERTQDLGMEELRLARAKRDAALAAIAATGGRTGIDSAMAAIAGTGRPDLEQGFGARLAKSGLANWLTQQGLVRGGLRAALPQIHREFIDAGFIPEGTRVPRFTEGVTADALADYYVRLGVPAERFADWFGGVSAPGAAAGAR